MKLDKMTTACEALIVFGILMLGLPTLWVGVGCMAVGGAGLIMMRKEMEE